MTEQGKTLGQLNVQPGDVVRCVDDNGHPWWTVGKEYDVCEVYESEDGLIIKDDDGDPWLSIPDAFFTVVSRNEVNPSQDGASIPPADPAPVTWPDGVTEMRVWNAAIEAAIEACVTEYLEDPNPESEGDVAYQHAVADCFTAIRALKKGE